MNKKTIIIVAAAFIAGVFAANAGFAASIPFIGTLGKGNAAQ